MKIQTNRPQRILEEMRGKQVEIPELRGLFLHYSGNVHPSYADIRDLTNIYIESLYPDDTEKANKVKSTDLALLACLWWPNTGFKELHALSLLIIWLLMWDDALDQASESMGCDFRAGQEFRDQTRHYMKAALVPESQAKDLPFCENHFIQRFDPIANFIKKKYDEEHIKLIMEEIIFTINISELEQQQRAQNNLPSLDEYWKFRLGTNLTGVVCAATELSMSARLPYSIIRHPLMQHIWHQTNVIISMMNDILSLKKEVEKGETRSLIPLLLESQGSIQSAVNIAVQMLKEVIVGLESYHSELGGELDNFSVEQFVEICHDYCTGFLQWSLTTSCYKLHALPKNEKGSMILSL